MNKLTITKCIECANWTPADSLGFGTYCDELGQVISEKDEEIDIPDICPKLASQQATPGEGMNCPLGSTNDTLSDVFPFSVPKRSQ